MDGCGSLNVHRMAGKTQAGYFLCNGCRGKFTARTGTVFERSHIPLCKWLMAIHIMSASKKSVSALQLQRMLGLGSYRTAWFMCMRIREAMKPTKGGPKLGGKGRVVEIDETIVGGKSANRAYAKKLPEKHTVLTLVERDGESRSFRIANVKANTLRTVIDRAVDRQSNLVTDELQSYKVFGYQYASHKTVNHRANEYVWKDYAYTNTAESRFSLMKRAIVGAHHSVSEAHLPRYLAEWDFKWNTRKMKDGERAALALKGAEGKRLMYRIPDKAAH